MSVATSLWTKVFPQISVLNNPSQAEVRSFAAFEEKTAASGAPCYYTRKAGSRSAKSTFVYEDNGFKVGRFQQKADSDLTKLALETVHGQMGKVDWLSFDRMIGSNAQMQFHVRLLIPKQYARIALLWFQTLFPAGSAQRNPAKEPDILTIYFPQWLEHASASAKERLPERMILVNPEAGINYVLGVDYVGETKMSFLR
ncbi:MAG: phosphoenolpyruvate carboxykinase (ATP), partial [Elusimicrobia bacterium]|nr:phosphoenolpyruvate carboxykinase (ATP) [Elusimicrobiota bacterium]